MSYLLVSSRESWLQSRTLELVESTDWDGFLIDPDVHFVEPKKSIGIDAVREIARHVAIKPFGGVRSVVVLQDAQTLTVEAQNALLKLLEEPPPYCTIVLWTKKSETLLPTMLSRCFLIEDVAHEEKSLAEEDKNRIETLLAAGWGERLAIVKKLPADNDRVKQLLASTLLYFREILLYKTYEQMGLSKEKTVLTIKSFIRLEALTTKQVNNHFLLDQIVLHFPKVAKRQN